MRKLTPKASTATFLANRKTQTRMIATAAFLSSVSWPPLFISFARSIEEAL
jgi:hypothetical protein